MKKILYGLLIIILTGCSNSEINNISNKLEIDNLNCQIEESIDTHGGFLGDGDYFVKLNCKDFLDTEIKINWKELPLSNELQDVMNLKQCDNKDCLNVYERYHIPNITKGYYYFLDRHSESTNKKSTENINNRASYNFTLGIYDSVNKILYFYELDT